MTTQKLFYTKYFSPETLQILVTAQFISKKLQTTQYNKKYESISLLTSNGILNKSNAILRYLAHGTNLYPSKKQEIDSLNTWYEYFNVELFPLLNQLYAQIFGQKESNEIKYQYCIDQIQKNLKVLDESLKIKSFFIGNTMTIFDITLTCYLENLLKLVITQSEFKRYSNLKRWHTYIRDIPLYNKFYGKRILCGNVSFKIDFPPANKNEEQSLNQNKTKSAEKNQSQKETKTDLKKQTKVEASVKVEEGIFGLDDWKRQFQNSQNKEEVVKKLLDSFEKQYWSIWKIHYLKDVTQGKVLFLTQNLANGTLQRLEGLRKNGFGTWGVYGDKQDFQIRGVMMWKGNEKNQAWKQHPSVEYHAFTKLDPTNNEDRKIIFDYWLQKQSAEGLLLQSTKVIV